MDLQTQLEIPPPIQPDGFLGGQRVDGASPPPVPHTATRQNGQEDGPHFELQPTGRIHTRLRKAHRRLSPLMIFIGYITSAGLGIGIGVLILKYAGLIDVDWNLR